MTSATPKAADQNEFAAIVLKFPKIAAMKELRSKELQAGDVTHALDPECRSNVHAETNAHFLDV